MAGWAWLFGGWDYSKDLSGSMPANLEDDNHNNFDRQSAHSSTVYTDVKSESTTYDTAASTATLNSCGTFVCCSNELEEYHKHSIDPEPQGPSLYCFKVNVHKNGLLFTGMAPRLAGKMREIESQMETLALQPFDNNPEHCNSSTPIIKWKSPWKRQFDESSEVQFESAPMNPPDTCEIPPVFDSKMKQLSNMFKMCRRYAEKSEKVLYSLTSRKVPNAKDLFNIEEDTEDSGDDGLSSISAPVPSMESEYYVQEEDIDELCESAKQLEMVTARMKELLDKTENLNKTRTPKAIDQKKSSAKKRKLVKHRPRAVNIDPFLRRG